jgi:hypothetical protein
MESFRITDMTSGTEVIPTTCETPDLKNACRTIKLSKDGVTTNGVKEFTFKITARAKGNGLT